jgi:probable F420-dependent oxidoreductase
VSVKKPSFSISTYNYGAEDIVDLARTAERLGFDTLWFGEHYVIPQRFTSGHPATSQVEYNEDWILAPTVRLYDPWFLLGTIAGATRRLKIGTGICIVPLNHPLLLARVTATAWDMSRGRFLLGTGVGWLKEEFDALGIPFDQRGSRMDEMLDILKKAWRGGFFEHHGRHFDVAGVQISPHPVDVPLVCGGNSKVALRRVARMADAWLNSSMITLEQALRLRDALEAERKAQGTAGRPFSYHVRPPTIEPEEIERFVREGFEHIVLWGPHLWPNKATPPLERKVEALTALARSLGLDPMPAS